MLAIQRKDTEQWAIPGGMVDDGEAVSATVRREFEEEAGNVSDPKEREVVRGAAQPAFGARNSPT